MGEGQPVIGIDVGGTRIKVALVAPDGQVLRDHVRTTPVDLATTMVETIRDIVHAIGGEGCAIGLVVPGLVDDHEGVGVWAANLGWTDLPIRAMVERALGVPVAVGHDVRAGLLGEHHHGAAKDCDDVVFVALGTGLAIAAMSSGAVVSGTPWTGELGHIVVVPDGRRCGCGQLGCLETVASARGIAAEFVCRGAGQSSPAPSEGEAVTIGADHVAALVDSGDALATQVWQESIDHLTGALAPVLTTLGTQRVVIGGGLIGAGETYLRPFRRSLAARLPQRMEVEVVAAELGDRAASLGAAVLARALIQSRQ
ncbi:MAG TPA: ROK family protein [Phycicoccus sp.]|nr:ROK family protein [Phycicoccus sp.]